MASAMGASPRQGTNLNAELKAAGKKIVSVGNEFEDSDDEGLKIGDMIQPGSDKLNVGPPSVTTEFTENDRKTWVMQYNVDHIVAINEYGSNMFKSKFDPLTTIEEKTAIVSSKMGDLDMTIDSDMVNQEGDKMSALENMSIIADSPSLIRGTQEGPQIELSSKEEEKEQYMSEDGKMTVEWEMDNTEKSQEKEEGAENTKLEIMGKTNEDNIDLNEGKLGRPRQYVNEHKSKVKRKMKNIWI